MAPLLPTSSSFLRLQGERRGAAGGLLFAGRRIPWGELAAAADDLAGWLARRGVGAGQHVGVTAANDPALLAMLYALWGLGAVAVPIGVRATAAETARLLAHARASGLFADSPRAEVARDAAAAVGLPAWVCRPELPLAPRLLRRGRARSAPRSRLAAIAYTSGTTGAPKGVMLTPENFLWATLACGQARGDTADSIGACLSPLTHVPVLVSHLLCRVLAGSGAVLFERFELGTVLEAVERHGITDLPLIGGMVFDVVQAGSVPAAVGQAGAGRDLRRRGDHRGVRPDRVDRRGDDGARRERVRARGHRRLREPVRRRRGGARRRYARGVRRGGRDRDQRPDRDGGLLPGPRRDGGGAARRLAPHRRPRAARRGRLLLRHRAPEGRHPHRGRERVARRGGGGAARAPRRGRRGGDRHAASQVGRAGDRGGRAAPGHRPRPGRARRLRPRAACRLQEAAPHRVRGRAAAQRRQQGRDASPPAAVHWLMETLAALLDATVARFPEREALAYAPHGEVTARRPWGEARAGSRRGAARLRAAGAGQGTRVALLCSNRPEWLPVAFGAGRLGAVR